MKKDEAAAPAGDVETGERAARVRGPGRRLRGAVANKIGTAILSGEYGPGDILSGEIAAAEALNVSRGAYREAMQVLAAKGLVESRPKTGTRVLPRERWNLLDPEVLAWAFAGDPDARLIRSLFELRLVIEPAAAAFAAQRRSKADIKRMRDALNGMRRHSLATAEGRAADRAVADAAGSVGARKWVARPGAWRVQPGDGRRANPVERAMNAAFTVPLSRCSSPDRYGRQNKKTGAPRPDRGGND